MANSKKLPANSPKKSLQHQLKAVLADVFQRQQLLNPRLALAFSGGLDSCVLLHLLAECHQSLPFRLQAHHVHHGLSPHADAWQSFCQQVCDNLRIPLVVSKVKIDPSSGLGVEAAAREARYQALLTPNSGENPDLICLAHHQDDQAETLLLQLARGAGVKGLAGMALANGRLLRPLLGVPRSVLASYAKQHQLAWIEDESNVDTKFDRNFMRHRVLPALEEQYPAIKKTISRAAMHMADADTLLDELASLDIKNCQENLADNKRLSLLPLANLSTARINNALRWWLQQHDCDTPSTARLQQIAQQLLYAKTDANIQIKLSSSHILRRFQGNAFLVGTQQKADLSFNRNAFSLHWRGESPVTLPDASRLFFSEKAGAGIALPYLENMQLKIGYRRGGETIKLAANRPSRSLKNLFQSANIPPWQRESQPLLFLDDALVMLPNIAIDVRYQVKAGETGLLAEWLPGE